MGAHPANAFRVWTPIHFVFVFVFVFVRLAETRTRGRRYRDTSELLARLVGHGGAFVGGLRDATGADARLSSRRDALLLQGPGGAVHAARAAVCRRVSPAAQLAAAPLRRWLCGGRVSVEDAVWLEAARRDASVAAWSGVGAAGPGAPAPHGGDEARPRWAVRSGAFRRATALLRELSGTDVMVRGGGVRAARAGERLCVLAACACVK